MLDSDILQEDFRQNGNVLSALPERRNNDRKGGDSVIKISSEFLVLDVGEKIHIAGTDDPDINLHFSRAAQTTVSFLLKNPEQLGLKLIIHLGYLIKKQSSALRRFKKSGFPALPGPCKSAVFITEKLHLQQGLA